jgi:hypothetical protein
MLRWANGRKLSTRQVLRGGRIPKGFGLSLFRHNSLGNEMYKVLLVVVFMCASAGVASAGPPRPFQQGNFQSGRALSNGQIGRAGTAVEIQDVNGTFKGFITCNHCVGINNTEPVTGNPSAPYTLGPHYIDNPSMLDANYSSSGCLSYPANPA